MVKDVYKNKLEEEGVKQGEVRDHLIWEQYNWCKGIMHDARKKKQKGVHARAAEGPAVLNTYCSCCL
jgi:hypothetical protein